MWTKFHFLTLAVVLFVLAGTASAGLVARYTFDDGTASDSAYFYPDADGTFFGDATVIDDANRGKVLSLDGNGDYVKVLNTNVAEFSTESFSYAFWVKSPVSGTWYYFWKGENVGGQPNPDDNLHGTNCYHDDTSVVRFSLYDYIDPGDGRKRRTEVNDVNCVKDQWTHIACVRDTPLGELRFYVNGKLEPEDPDSENANPAPDGMDVANAGSLYIGANDRGFPTHPANYYLGEFDDFRVYNHVLSEQEIQFLANDQIDPNLASDPSPEPGESDACPDTVLSWTAGANALSHDVYFGTSGEVVTNATTSDSEYQGNQASTSYDAGSAHTLVEGQTYFWRVDEVGVSQTWKGDVWKFTVNDGKANHPDPEDGVRFIPLDQVLSWRAGCFATSHDVYFGTDFNDVNDATTSSAEFIGNQALGNTQYDPGGLEYSLNYYWRIDEIGDPTVKGDVWTFKAVSAIFDPNLRVWYEFGDGTGTDVVDSSGREFDGQLQGESKLDPNGYYDGGLLMEDNGYVFVPIPVLEEIASEITVTGWLKTGKRDSEDNIVLAAGADWEDYYMRISVPDDDAAISFRAGNDSNDVLKWIGNSAAWVDSWNYFTFVKNENDGTMQIYINGVRIAEQDTASSGTLANLRYREIRIGAETDDNDSYDGMIDELRIYDRALTPDEIAALYRGGNVGVAWAPLPLDGASDVPRSAELSWRPGDYAVEHDIYFGTSFNDVNDADTSSGVYAGRQGANTYDPPGDLDLDKVYYWRIDEVNNSDVNSPWKGNVWRFTVANFLIVDDMESYDSFVNRIWQTWDNPWGSGSFVELGAAPFAPVHGGTQSMEYLYDNLTKWDFFSYWSEAQYDFDTSQDWTDAGVRALTLFLYGDPDNDIGITEQFSIGVEGTSRVDVDLPDMNDLLVAEWQEWNIDLSEFAAATLTAIDTVYLKFGDSSNTDTPGGDGIVYFDDIRLYPPRCIPSEGPPADLSGNCIVDFADIGIVGWHWLRSDENLTVSAPAASPVAHWQLDDAGGTTASDSSVNGFNGTLEGSCLWADGHIGSGSVDFSGGRVLVPDAALLRPTSNVTAMAWIFSERSQDAARVLVKGPDNRETYEIEAAGESDADFVVRENGNDSSFVRHSVAAENLVLNEWIHLAGTYDQSDLKIYVNGQLEASDTIGAFTLSQDPNGMAIGNRSDADNRPFYGYIDDVRVYSTALTEPEIAYVATQGTGYVPLQSLANLYDGEAPGSKIVNLRDYAALMNSWLEQKLWPE